MAPSPTFMLHSLFEFEPDTSHFHAGALHCCNLSNFGPSAMSREITRSMTGE